MHFLLFEENIDFEFKLEFLFIYYLIVLFELNQACVVVKKFK